MIRTIAEIQGYVDEIEGADARVILDNDGRDVEITFELERLSKFGVGTPGDRFIYRVVEKEGFVSFRIEKILENPYAERVRALLDGLKKELDQ